ncbi:hypothetical protein PYCCODRAFT_1438493 [Trametes coccinea BRFM310]|uniref:Uncharacterized protein n=1 Tax=Trametes coccinea (strain BRFM310) TaxID=1353009 RepID=A0A1Y2IDR9_TRAC3|nr:hypothetical protein PYCCODRAFT_1438493 [Trametes coccinea BRFM310]
MLDVRVATIRASRARLQVGRQPRLRFSAVVHDPERQRPRTHPSLAETPSFLPSSTPAL